MKHLSDIDINENNVLYGQGATSTVEISTSDTATTPAFSFTAASYRSAKFFVSTTSSTDYSVRELLAVHDGVDGYITEYALVNSDLETVDDVYTFDISGVDAVLSVTPATGTARTIRIFATLIS